MLVARFGEVFFCPGNHDLWLHKDDGCADSVGKYERLKVLCSELGVHTEPKIVRGVLIVPVVSWYHSSFDSDPDVPPHPSLVPIEDAMMDFHLCKWPPGLSALGGSDSVARHFDELNGGMDSECARWLDPPPGAAIGDETTRPPVISFSHFLPRPELLPEKRALFFPPLAKAVGSVFLGERVRRIMPDCHIFGHTHYAWSATVDGIKYVQACLAYPQVLNFSASPHVN